MISSVCDASNPLRHFLVCMSAGNEVLTLCCCSSENRFVSERGSKIAGNINGPPFQALASGVHEVVVQALIRRIKEGVRSILTKEFRFLNC